ncbi:hypothetical protein Tco_0189134 [Tanacetum coccineum]
MKVFPLSLTGDVRKWWMNEGDGKITTLEELEKRFFGKLYPLSCASNYDKMCEDDEEVASWLGTTMNEYTRGVKINRTRYYFNKLAPWESPFNLRMTGLALKLPFLSPPVCCSVDTSGSSGRFITFTSVVKGYGCPIHIFSEGGHELSGFSLSPRVGEMDLNAFIRTADPRKVKIVERARAENERPIVTNGCAKATHRDLSSDICVRSSENMSASVEREFVGYARIGDELRSRGLKRSKVKKRLLYHMRELPFAFVHPPKRKAIMGQLVVPLLRASPLEEARDRTDSATGPSSNYKSAAPVMTEATTVAIPADVSKDKSAPHLSVFGSSSSSEKYNRTLSLLQGKDEMEIPLSEEKIYFAGRRRPRKIEDLKSQCCKAKEESAKWLLTHGMKLLVVKCLNSNEYMEALGHAFGRAIEKGMQEGLAAGIEHGQAGKCLIDLEAYIPSAEDDFNSAIRDLNFSLLKELSDKKDASTWDIIDLLRLDDTVAETLRMTDLHPDVNQLMVPVHHKQDRVVIGSQALSVALDICRGRVEKMERNLIERLSFLKDVFVSIDDPLSAEALIKPPAEFPSTNVLSIVVIIPHAEPSVSVEDYDKPDS